MTNDYNFFIGLGFLVLGILLIIIGAHNEWW